MSLTVSVSNEEKRRGKSFGTDSSSGRREGKQRSCGHVGGHWLHIHFCRRSSLLNEIRMCFSASPHTFWQGYNYFQMANAITELMHI